MQEVRQDQTQVQSRRGPVGLLPILIIWGLVALAAVSLLGLEAGAFGGMGRYYMIPWSLLAGIAILVPSGYVFFKKGFDLFHPLVFGVWTYIFPAFVLGGIILAFGLSEPYFLAFIEDPEFNLPLSLFYVVIGYLAVVAGFFLPLNKFAVRGFERMIPSWKWELNDVWVPGLVLIGIGIGFNVLGFLQGVLGYQRIDQTGLFDGLFFFLTVIFNIGNLLLWLAVFQTKKRPDFFYPIVGLLILMPPLKMALQGSRGSLILSLFPIAMAFWYSGRRLKWQHAALSGVIFFVAISVGIVYGTTFRNIKGSEERINAGDYAGQVIETIDYISRTETSKLISEGSRTFFERIENLSSLGVVVANHKSLEVYEESYGLKNNIVNDLMTAFIPRFVWPDKPSTSEPRAYSDLYFNYGENSFAITPFGDLLRNFGPFGIVIGMMIVGVYFRIIYSLLIDTPEPRIWKKMAYFPLLSVVSYEAFYATIVPSMVRVLVILVV